MLCLDVMKFEGFPLFPERVCSVITRFGNREGDFRYTDSLSFLRTCVRFYMCFSKFSQNVSASYLSDEDKIRHSELKNACFNS
jgi:hypothetical protein